MCTLFFVRDIKSSVYTVTEPKEGGMSLSATPPFLVVRACLLGQVHNPLSKTSGPRGVSEFRIVWILERSCNAYTVYP